MLMVAGGRICCNLGHRPSRFSDIRFGFRVNPIGYSYRKCFLLAVLWLLLYSKNNRLSFPCKEKDK